VTVFIVERFCVWNAARDSTGGETADRAQVTTPMDSTAATRRGNRHSDDGFRDGAEMAMVEVGVGKR
jgi:hypothetical protein